MISQSFLRVEGRDAIGLVASADVRVTNGDGVNLADAAFVWLERMREASSSRFDADKFTGDANRDFGRRAVGQAKTAWVERNPGPATVVNAVLPVSILGGIAHQTCVRQSHSVKAAFGSLYRTHSDVAVCDSSPVMVLSGESLRCGKMRN